MHPKDFFGGQHLVNAGHCFLIMPFADDFNDVHSAIKAALKVDELRFTCHRADEATGGGLVMTDVLRYLAMAEIVIADLTGKNANVFYELGIAHTVKEVSSVLLITQNIEDVPFDVRTNRRIEYKLGPDGLRSLQDELIEVIRTLITRRRVFTVAKGDTYESEAIFPGKDGLLYSFAICDLMLGIDLANYQLKVSRHPLNLPVETIHNEPCRHSLGLRKPIPEIPGTPWALKLDAANIDEAVFCVCKPDQ
jgi:hypothetical protein